VGERERATLIFNGEKLKIHWDYRPDGVDWAVLCEFECVNQRHHALAAAGAISGAAQQERFGASHVCCASPTKKRAQGD
jgi:hypothetical protein